MNKKPCSSCSFALYSDYTNTLFCDNQSSKQFLLDVTKYPEPAAQGAPVELVVLDCTRFYQGGSHEQQ